LTDSIHQQDESIDQSNNQQHSFGGAFHTKVARICDNSGMNVITTGVARKRLDSLFAFDAAASVCFGVVALLTPHGILMKVSGGEYNHNVHETLRCGFLNFRVWDHIDIVIPLVDSLIRLAYPRVHLT
jgi:hypothetical protein